jgi:uncharacterized protein (DUF58 family)
VKKYVDERELTVLFLLDLSLSMTGGFSSWSARQMATRACACLALSAIKNDDKVGLIAFSGEVDRYVPPAKGAGHVLRIVRDCLALRGSEFATDLAPPLEFAARILRRRAILFLMSDFLAEGWQEALGRCSRRHDVIAVRILCPELDPPRSGLMRIRDPETGDAALVDWASPGIRHAYAARIEGWKARTAADLRRAKVDVLDMAIPRERDPDAIARPILRFFNMRELRGAKR